MIFYFSGTGNSRFAAQCLALKNERLIDIAEANQNRTYDYSRNGHERVGFVFPEYCASVPKPVLDFISELRLTGRGYTFAVVTCGGSMSLCGGLLRHRLAERGIPLYYITHVRMPDNAIVFFDTPKAKKTRRLLLDSEQRLRRLHGTLRCQPVKPVRGGLTASAMQPVYRLARTTKPFFADACCTHCGLCARCCPEQAIEMQDGRPVWVKASCALCTACINRCPTESIQYGNGTRARHRYTHPTIRSRQPLTHEAFLALLGDDL